MLMVTRILLLLLVHCSSLVAGGVTEVATRAKTYDLKQVHTKPLPVKQVDPEYPEWLREMRIEGRVDVYFVVKADGHVADAKAVRSTHEGLSKIAVEAVQQWIFHPATVEGKPVNCRLIVPITFALSK